VGGDDVHPEVRADAALVAQGEEGVIVDTGPRAAPVQLGVDVADGAEQQEGLVDEVGAQVEEEAPRLLRGRILPPPRLRDGAPALEPGLEAMDVAELTLVDEAPEREEVAVPPAVLVRAWSMRRRASAADAASGLSTTTWSPASRASRPRGTWVRLGVAMTTASSRSTISHTRATSGTTVAAGYRLRAAWARPESLVTMAATARPSVASMSGAWNADPARP
jgi:hypothetical protein